MSGPTGHESFGNDSGVEAGTLYLCGTPIGNLEDITLRALRILKEVDLIAAEDTRRTGNLLRAYDIRTPLISLHEHNERTRSEEIIRRLAAGETVAVVSDAGMPGISDPGALLVQRCVEAGHRVVPVPGPTAFVAALVASGLSTERFVFEGFLPRQGRARREALEKLSSEARTIILYEAPHRLQRLLSDLVQHLGASRLAVVARELTKVHETFVRGTLAELEEHFQRHAPRGECVVLVAGGKSDAPGEHGDDEVDQEAIGEALAARMEEGMSRRDAIREVAAEWNLPRRLVYEIAVRKK